MKSLSLILLILAVLGSFTQAQGQASQAPCDTNYIEIFSKDGFVLDHIPCDSFIVINLGYYKLIYQGYNLRGELLAGRAEMIENLQKQVALCEQLNDTLSRVVDFTKRSLDDYRKLTDDYRSKLDQSLTMNKTIIDSTTASLALLRKEHRQEVTKAKFKNFLLGGVIGAFVGFITALVLFNR